MKNIRRMGADSSIPTSSMADIAFLLIIFFMVTSVFAATKGLELSLPTDEALPPDPEPQDAVFIHVEASGVQVDCQPMQLGEIRPYLEPILRRNPSKPVILYTDPEAEYRRMVAVYEVLIDGTSGDRLVRDIFIPTRSDIDGYVEVFGENPLQNACR